MCSSDLPVVWDIPHPSHTLVPKSDFQDLSHLLRGVVCMASIRFRGDRYEARLRTSGKAVSKSFKSLQDAQKWALSVELGLYDCESLDPQVTFWDALERYHQECGRHKKGARQEQERIRALERTSWGSKPLSRVTTSDIRHMRDSALAMGLSGSAVRLLMCTVSVVYKYAKSEWGCRVTNPVLEVLMPKAPPPRSRRICGDELQRLLDECGRCRNHYVLPSVQVSLETGLRQSELLGLTWDDVDIDRKSVV